MPKRIDSSDQAGWSLTQRNPGVIRAFMPFCDWLYRYYFRVHTSGWHHISPEQTTLFVGSHNGGLAAPDMVMMMYDWFRRFGADRPAYGLLHPSVWRAAPAVAHLAMQVGAVRAHPKMAIAALRQGASVLVYPGGARDVFRPHALRHKICLSGNRAFIKLALKQNVPIIPLVSHGAHDTLIILTDIYEQVQQLHEWGMPWLLGVDPEVFPIYLGLPWGLGVGPLPNIPLPVPIHTRVCAPIVFDRYGQAAARDRTYVDQCYHRVLNEMQQELDALVKAVDSEPSWGRGSRPKD
jgi:1-acyl-sn-glycerol-3-phosphate acyltransferase